MIIRMDLTIDDEEMKKFVFETSTFVAVLKDGGYVMDFSSAYGERIEVMRRFPFIRRIERKISDAGGKLINIFVVYYSQLICLKFHQDRGNARSSRLRACVTHGTGKCKCFQFKDPTSKAYSDPILVQDGCIVVGDSYAFGKCKSSAIQHAAISVKESFTTIIDFECAETDTHHEKMFSSLSELDDGTIDEARDYIQFSAPEKDGVAKRDNKQGFRSRKAKAGAHARLANTDKVDCGIRGKKYNMCGHGAVNCGGRGLRMDQGRGAVDCIGRGLRIDQGLGAVDCIGRGLYIDQGHGAVDCGGRGLHIDLGHGAVDCGGRGLHINKGHGAVVIQGRGAFVSWGLGTIMNYNEL